MSKSFTQFKRMSLEEKIKTTLENWQKLFVIGIGTLLVTTILSCGVYNLGVSMTTSTESKIEGYSLVDYEIRTPAKKTLFILYTSILGISSFAMSIHLDFTDKLKYLEGKEKTYKIFSYILTCSSILFFSTLILYYIGSHVSPIIFG
jgi:hypothetical protein